MKTADRGLNARLQYTVTQDSWARALRWLGQQSLDGRRHLNMGVADA